MAITLKKITVWRKEVDNKPGALADTLALLAQARTDLQAVMGYRYPEDQGKAVIELHPVSGKKAIDAPDQRDWLLHRSRRCSCRATTDPVLATQSPKRWETPVST